VVSFPALRRLAGAALVVPAIMLAGAAPAAADGEADPAAAAPTIALTAPAAGGTIGAGVATALTAVTPGAIAVLSVHVDGGPPLCVFTQVHAAYACPWTPQAKDVGAHVVQARVQTADGQVAITSMPLVVGRLLPAAVGATTSRRPLTNGGWRLSTTGSVGVPQGLTAAACAGRATVTVLAGTHTVVDRSVPVAADCRFASRVTIAAPRATRALRVKVSYGGAQLLAPRAAPAQTLRLR
jgi:hypothetical protein